MKQTNVDRSSESIVLAGEGTKLAFNLRGKSMERRSPYISCIRLNIKDPKASRNRLNLKSWAPKYSVAIPIRVRRLSSLINWRRFLEVRGAP